MKMWPDCCWIRCTFYRKVPKFLNARNFAVIQTKRPNLKVFCQKTFKHCQMEMQTVKTLIRLLLEEQSDLGLEVV